MILSYQDIIGDQTRHNVSATITTEHPLSSYNQPIILLDDGDPLNIESWVLLNYRVEKATTEELKLLRQWISWIALLIVPGEQQRRAGSSKSDRKARASRENGKLGGRPKKQ